MSTIRIYHVSYPPYPNGVLFLDSQLLLLNDNFLSLT
jgi:hypothetical protein